VGRHLHLRQPAGLDGELREEVTDVVRQSLRVGRGSRTAAPDVIVELRDLVGGAVGDVGSGGYAGVFYFSSPGRGERWYGQA
jgi:hypothetical protein